MSASAVVIHYEEALYHVYAPLPSPYLYIKKMKLNSLQTDRYWNTQHTKTLA